MTTEEDETVQFQLAEWLAGRPWHNTARGECCPDFSCCQPHLLADEDARRAFVNGSPETRHRMLYGFLGKALQESKVYVAGDPDIEKLGEHQ